MDSVHFPRYSEFICTDIKPAPGVEPDLDDSAKASIFLCLSRIIIKNFGGPKCLSTYYAERDPSVSANCNTLLCILFDSAGYSFKSSTVEKSPTRFVTGGLKPKATFMTSG